MARLGSLECWVTVAEVRQASGRVVLAVDAPRCVAVVREELVGRAPRDVLPVRAAETKGGVNDERDR